MPFTRRDWMIGSLGLAAWAEIAAAQQAGRFEALDPESAKEIEAIAAQILPSDDGPGAREAGVIYFIDRALSTFDADKKELYRKGMDEVQQSRRKMFPNSASIAALESAQQMELIRAIEKSEFFDQVRTHTVLGFLGNPSYGGNRGEAGWRHIGFEHRMAFEHPFGYYDAEEQKGGAR